MAAKSEIRLNDAAWQKLFAKYHILTTVDRESLVEITARQINEFREARLMTKFDHRVNLPKPFADNGLSILPVTRGSYIIARMEAYHPMPEQDSGVARVPFPDNIESIDFENITSESMAINCAYVCGILSDFLEDDGLVPTISGRMSSSVFDFEISSNSPAQKLLLTVTNSQVEIDGGYEGAEQLCLIEAKNFLSEDFLVRQLYYPFRLWQGKLRKQVIPVFLVYSNSVFSLYQYDFEDPCYYNSLTLVKHRRYSIEPTEIDLEDILSVLGHVETVEEPEMPFPQADDFRRVVNLCELLAQGDMTRDDITLNYAFDPRQTNYYTDAGRYLGLVDKTTVDGKISFSLTQEGLAIVRSKYKSRQLKYVEAILRHKAFSDTLRLYLVQCRMPSKGQIVGIMRACDLYRVAADSTFQRRASTISGWVNWILDLPR